MKKITRHSAAAALELLPDGVLIVRLTGPLTSEALMTVKAGIVSDYAPGQIRAFVADYTGAVVAMTGEQLDQILEGESDGVAGRPAAIVARPEVADLLAQHAARMALHGIRRRVFLDHGLALAWVRSRAARSAGS